MTQDTKINVEVIYALPSEQAMAKITLDAGATVAQAIKSSGLLARYPEINLEKNKTGIFGKIAALDTVLQPSDRVEIYRPLIADPKEARRRRVVLKKRQSR